MEQCWTCRDYENGDERHIIALFARVFQRRMSLAYWKWRFIDNPYGRGVIKLLFDRDKLVGHHAVTPMQVHVQDEPARAAFCMTIMTDPDYRGRGIFTFLAEEVYKSCVRQGFSFVYGFPNENSYPGFTGKLGWKDLGRRAVMSKELDTSTERQSQLDAGNVYRVNHFDSSLDSLWDKVKESYEILVPRVAEFLNWRFVDNPEVKYAKYIAGDTGKHVAGYVVLKEYYDGRELRGHIVDMLSVNDNEVVKVLLGHCYEYFGRRHIRKVSCWMPAYALYCNRLKDDGFETEESGAHFGLRMLKPGDTLGDDVECTSKWFLTMGDSDVF